MPLIKPRTRGKQFVRLITRLDRENNETLYAYAHFIGESAEYVLNQLVEAVLAKDKEFVAWRADHPDSSVPLPVRQRRKQKQAMQVDRARPASLPHPAVSSAVAR
ncbi:MAG TPA: hypothetical protein VKC15_15180 [Gemmatimonadales bacterium]|jgi:hypothetical protein|nr:hypothetical protein [Gemmatimonadales bacterium]